MPATPSASAARSTPPHLLPVGIFRPGVMNVIGNGVVLDPEALFAEIDGFLARGVAISPENLRISYKTHLVMPYHKAEDAARESSAEGGGIGTTRRGIGPAYADKMQRTTALRVADLMHEEKLKQRIAQIVTERNKVLKVLYDAPPVEWKAVFEQYRDFGRRMKPFVDDTTWLLLQAIKAGKQILFEGAHAVLLDIDHGTYPYVTSSNCSALGLYTGAGVPPQTVDELRGDHEGLHDARRRRAIPNRTEQRHRQLHPRARATNTARPPAARAAAAGSTPWPCATPSPSAASLTSCSRCWMSLGGLERVQVCTGYKYRGQSVDFFRADMDVLAEVEPVYETLPGWAGQYQRLPTGSTNCRGSASNTSSASSSSSARRSGW